MHKAKHSKFRNTGILFELLTRQVTSDILSGKDESFAKNILFKYFSENKELGKELQLYNFLVNEVAKDETQAEKYIEIVLKQRDKLNQKSLTSEKYNLIKEIKDVYPINDLFKSSIKNYKVLASIYKIFENHSDKNSKFDVKEIVSSRTSIVENLCGSRKVVKETEDEMINVYKQQNEEVRLLSYKILIESLNEKYKDLDSSQKNLLKEYINNITNTTGFKSYVEKEIPSIVAELTQIQKMKDQRNSNKSLFYLDFARVWHLNDAPL